MIIVANVAIISGLTVLLDGIAPSAMSNAISFCLYSLSVTDLGILASASKYISLSVASAKLLRRMNLKGNMKVC